MIGDQGEFEHVGHVGDSLRAAREAQGLTLGEIAQRTRIPMRHLQMIEAGEYQGLPAATYSAGFVKSYARLLDLDGQALSLRFRDEIGSATPQQQAMSSYEPADPRRTPPAWLALVALLVAVIGGLGYLYWRGSQVDPAELALRSTAAPAPAVTRGPAAPVAGVATSPAAAGAAVVIGASEEVWIKVADAGKTLYIGTLKPGDHYQVPADAADPVLTTGRPGNTTITVGATPIPTVGDPDRAARNVSLKAQALLARVATPPPAVQPPPGAPTPVTNEAGPA